MSRGSDAALSDADAAEPDGASTSDAVAPFDGASDAGDGDGASDAADPEDGAPD